MSTTMESAIYNQKGKKIESASIPDSLFGLSWNADLVHQVMESERANQRPRVAHVKMRGEVRGGGKKPWRQKGTGRARHGSIRSPIWRKGGVAHGPNKEVDYSKKINKKMAKKALATVLSAKLRDNEVIFLDALSFADHKTKNAVEFVSAFSSSKEFPKFGQKGGKALILAPKHDTNALRATRNLKTVGIKAAPMAQVMDLLSYKYVVIPKEAIEVLAKKGSKG